MKRFVFGLIVAGVMSGGCSSTDHYVKKQSNTDRSMVVWKDAKERYISCLEHTGPAAITNNRTVGVTPTVYYQGITGSVAVNYNNAQSLAKIYNVSDILQFAHAQLYRICEARGNQIITDKQYAQLFTSTTLTTWNLLAISLGVTQPTQVITNGGMTTQGIEQPAYGPTFFALPDVSR